MEKKWVEDKQSSKEKESGIAEEEEVLKEEKEKTKPTAKRASSKGEGAAEIKRQKAIIFAKALSRDVEDDASKEIEEPDACTICLSVPSADQLSSLDSCSHVCTPPPSFSHIFLILVCYVCIKEWSSVTNKCPNCERSFNEITSSNSYFTRIFYSFFAIILTSLYLTLYLVFPLIIKRKISLAHTLLMTLMSAMTRDRTGTRRLKSVSMSGNLPSWIVLPSFLFPILPLLLLYSFF